MGFWNDRPRVSTEFQFRGVDAALLENGRLRVLVLPGKGGDILEFRDKRTDVDVLYHADYPWDPPSDRVVPSTETTWNEHYPGGWQVNLPVAGSGMDVAGSRYDHHGESALLPWDAEVARDDDEAVTLTLTTELRRYPFSVERDLTLPADASRLEISESVTNEGDVELEYAWQQHVALGRPLIGPEARLDTSTARGYVDDYGEDHDTNRLRGDQEFEWPTADGVRGDPVDLSEFPPTDAEIHDQAFLLEFDEPWYAVTNPELDLGFALRWSGDPFETLWYWQSFGGHDESPFWGRNYTAGLEPTTAYPGHSYPEAQRENGTLDALAPGETVGAEFVATTFCGRESVAGVDPDGTVRDGD